MVRKPRWVLVIGHHEDGRLAVASAVLITTQFAGTSYEVTLPRVPWLREQSYVNAQSIQPVKWTEFARKAAGTISAVRHDCSPAGVGPLAGTMKINREDGFSPWQPT